MPQLCYTGSVWEGCAGVSVVTARPPWRAQQSKASHIFAVFYTFQILVDASLELDWTEKRSCFLRVGDARLLVRLQTTLEGKKLS
ncbi:hypothetical protein O3P69_005580 [Scylla paramamosain]|uniref:Uncharacterized protein n=1 Tax=Scylla paramamosain TaxID=85552 RepID=A0AAW0U664_SCYPA